MAGKNPQDTLSDEDRRIYELAFQLSDQIKAKDGTTRNAKGDIERNYQEVEYLGLIYRDGNELKITRLYSSNDPSRVENSRAFGDAGGVENVVGVVHNHPYAHVEIMRDGRNGGQPVPQETAERANRLPSEGDWRMVKENFDGRKDVSLFIFDHESKLRAFDTEARSKWLAEVIGPSIGPRKGQPEYDAPPALDRTLFATSKPPEPTSVDSLPTAAAPILPSPTPTGSPTTAPPPDQASLQSQALYAQAMSNQLPSMQAYPDEQRQQMAGYATFMAAERGWNGIAGIGMNNATATQKAGDLLCIAGKSDNPDPHANGVAVPPDQAMKATPVEWLAQADAARQTLAQTQALTQQLAQSQEQSQSMEQGMVHRLVL